MRRTIGPHREIANERSKGPVGECLRKAVRRRASASPNQTASCAMRARLRGPGNTKSVGDVWHVLKYSTVTWQ